MAGKKIYVALSAFAKEGRRPLELLEQSGMAFDINPHGRRLTKEETSDLGRRYSGIIAGIEPYDAAVLEKLSGLKCISRCGVGLDNIDLPTARQKGIAVLNTPEVVIQPVVELTLALILDVLRKVSAHTASMRQRKWERLTGSQLAGKKAGVLGLGRIGRRMAQVLSQLGTQVCGYDIAPDTAWAKAHGVTLVSLEELCSTVDILTVHVSVDGRHPLRLGASHLNMMKKGEVLINTSRGNIIDEPALVEALKSGHLSGAGLDVYAQEPYTGPLCDLPNAVLTPHVATLTQESRLAMEVEAVENLINFFSAQKD